MAKVPPNGATEHGKLTPSERLLYIQLKDEAEQEIKRLTEKRNEYAKRLYDDMNIIFKENLNNTSETTIIKENE